jgi:integrase
VSTSTPPLGVSLSADVEVRPGRPKPYRARVRWIDPATGRRPSKSESFEEPEQAQAWLDAMHLAAQGGIDPHAATMRLAQYGDSVWTLAMRGLEGKTLDPYSAGWRKRVVPTLGHLPVRMLTNGAVDRAVHGWIADGCSRSTVKNSLAALVRVMEQAVRDGIRDRNPARLTGWQRDYQRAEDELDDPRALALPDWAALTTLAAALVDRSHGHYPGWGHVVTFAGGTAAHRRGVGRPQRRHRPRDLDLDGPPADHYRAGPGGLIDKGTKGKRAREVPIIEELRPMLGAKLDAAADADSRLFVGPRGGRISTAVLRDATHWDEVVNALGYEYLRRHDLRHTGLTWMADAGVLVHVLQKIAGHGSLTTTQRYLHPNRRAITAAGEALAKHLSAMRSPNGPREAAS